MYRSRIKNNFKNSFRQVALLLLIISFFSCNNKSAEKKVERSFYYWKSVVKLTNFEFNQLNALEVKTIYLKFFDVGWDAASKLAIPIAKLQVQENRLLANYQIIPTVFITNESIQKIDSSQIKVLADKIYRLIMDISTKNHIDKINEIQIDCDWSVTTSKKYFLLLKTIRQISKKSISATIRLHQIKFLSKTGVPPVDRGLLMCYNMGNLKNKSTKNSIIETAELKKYTGNLAVYPLLLDVAFPIFEWKVLFRDNTYKGLIENLPTGIFTNSFTLKKDGQLEILKDTLLAGYDLKKGDMLRTEESNIDEILSVAKEVNKHLKNTHLRVSLYHLDSVTLKKYSTHELESIYNSLY